MKRNLTPELKHEISCLKNTNKQLKSANEYHKGRVESLELSLARAKHEERRDMAIIVILFTLLFWFSVYHFFS